MAAVRVPPSASVMTSQSTRTIASPRRDRSTTEQSPAHQAGDLLCPSALIGLSADSLRRRARQHPVLGGHPSAPQSRIHLGTSCSIGRGAQHPGAPISISTDPGVASVNPQVSAPVSVHRLHVGAAITPPAWGFTAWSTHPAPPSLTGRSKVFSASVTDRAGSRCGGCGEHEFLGSRRPGDGAGFGGGEVVRVFVDSRLTLVARLTEEQVDVFGEPHPVPSGRCLPNNRGCGARSPTAGPTCRPSGRPQRRTA